MNLRARAQNISNDSQADTAAPGATGVLHGQEILLSTLSPRRAQTRLTLAIVLALLAAFLAMPFAMVPLGYTREFIPAYAAAMFVIILITLSLLLVQSSIVRSRALFAISGGYLFSTLMTILIESVSAFPVFDALPGRTRRRLGRPSRRDAFVQ
jgi:hypothetical protein